MRCKAKIQKPVRKDGEKGTPLKRADMLHSEELQLFYKHSPYSIEIFNAVWYNSLNSYNSFSKRVKSSSKKILGRGALHDHDTFFRYNEKKGIHKWILERHYLR